MTRSRAVPTNALTPKRSSKRPVEANATPRNQTIRFSFSELDMTGSWCLHDLDAVHVARLIKRLKVLEGMTLDQMFTSGVMSKLNMEKCPNKQATQRLARQYDGLDVVHEIRIARSEDHRLHGRLDGRFFNIIWWDPNHEVWPEGKNRR